jgi:hypothetical protein
VITTARKREYEQSAQTARRYAEQYARQLIMAGADEHDVQRLVAWAAMEGAAQLRLREEAS